MIEKQNYKPFFTAFAVISGILAVAALFADMDGAFVLFVMICMMCINGNANSKKYD